MGLSAVTKATAFMSYSKLIKILRQTESKSGTGQRFSEKETDSRAQIVIGPKAEMVVTQRAKNASLTKIWLPKQKMRRLGPILGRGTFCNFWYQYSLFVFRIGDFFSGMLNKDQSVLVVNIESAEIKTLTSPRQRVLWINPAANISFPLITPETSGFGPITPLGRESRALRTTQLSD